MRNRAGSSTIILAMVFVALSSCIVSAITLSRELVVSSECKSFGRLWAKAVLSEYDVHLLEDYEIMAYFGNENEVMDKVNAYIDFSISGKKGIRIGKTSCNLYAYEIIIPENFRKCIKKAVSTEIASKIKDGERRRLRSSVNNDQKNQDNTVINNNIVIDTLPSSGYRNSSVEINKISKIITQKGLFTEKSIDAALNKYAEMTFISSFLNSHITQISNKSCIFRNEIEYVIVGSLDDDKNFRKCKNKIFLLRNALNIFAIYKDPKKVEVINSLAAIITPGPEAALTQPLIAEAWAAYESETDLKALLRGERVPLLKTSKQWHTDMQSILNDKKIKDELNKSAKKYSDDERMSKFKELNKKISVIDDYKDGITYEEYLYLMIMFMNEDVRVARLMDIVQMNMKHRYYRDFNLAEYFMGVRFSLNINGKSYEFDEEYK